MNHWIELAIFKFLQDIQKKSYKIPEDLLNKFSKETREALKNQFEREHRQFDLYPSNVGKPLCVLQLDKKYGSSNTELTRNILGSLVEDLAVFLLHASGIKVISEQETVRLTINGKELHGRIDVVLENPKGEQEIYDIKSASDYSFKTKQDQSMKDVMDSDAFGYVHQLMLYSEAKLKDNPNIKPGGFIFVNKTDGHIFVLPVGNDYEELKQRALKEVAYNIKHINDPFKRVFEDIPETFRKKPTGNRILKMPCSLCSHKRQCWDIKTMPQKNSKSRNPKMVDYTFIKE